MYLRTGGRRPKSPDREERRRRVNYKDFNMATAPSSQPSAPSTPRGDSDVTAHADNTGVQHMNETSDFFPSDMENDTAPRATRRVLDSRFSCNICFEAVREPVVTQCGHLYCWSCLYRWLEPGIYPSERQGLGMMVQPPRPVDESRRCCPVCKTECSIPTIVPIYVRNEPPTPLQQQQKRRSDAQQQQRQEEPTEEPNNNANPVNATTESGSPQEEVHALANDDDDDDSLEENTGLRRRLRFRSHDSEIPDVPSRPGPMSSPTRRSPTHNPGMSSPVHIYRPPLSHGLAHSLWQSLSYTESSSSQPIPSLHQNRQSGNNPRQPYNPAVPADDDATEFLWRVLLMLGSFVVLCLLIF